MQCVSGQRVYWERFWEFSLCCCVWNGAFENRLLTVLTSFLLTDKLLMAASVSALTLQQGLLISYIQGGCSLHYSIDSRNFFHFHSLPSSTASHIFVSHSTCCCFHENHETLTSKLITNGSLLTSETTQNQIGPLFALTAYVLYYIGLLSGPTSGIAT